MITQASELRFQVKSREGDAHPCGVAAYVRDLDYDTARRRVEIALHRLGYDTSGLSSDGFGQIHLTNWLQYREERFPSVTAALPDQFELRNMLNAGNIFFVGLPSPNETHQYASN